MNSKLLGLAVFAMALTAGCTLCNSAACGFVFSVEVFGSDGLPDGVHEVEMEIEGKEYGITCTVGTVMGESACSADEAAGSFSISASVITSDGSPVIMVSMVDTSESSGDFHANRGPENLDVTVRYEGEVVAAGTYAPEYNRVDHRGAPACGYCDQPAVAERLEVVINP